MWAAHNGHSDIIKLLLEAGASPEAKDDVSKRISICTCVCVCLCVIFLHHSVVLFYSSILLLWYGGYDDFISMNNVFVFILIIIILLLVLSLANMKINILEKSLSSIFHEFLYLLYFCISSKYIFLINYCFSFFLSSSIFILSLTLILFFFVSFTLSVCLYFFLWFFFFLFLF